MIILDRNMPEISNDNKFIARKLASAFGGRPSVREYLHDNLPLKIDLLSCQDQPEEGVVSYGTIGVSDYSLRWGGGEFETRLEICGAIESSVEYFPNIITSAAFNIIRSRVVCYPGICMENYVKEYYPHTILPHLYFTSPFLWEDLKTTALKEKIVTWLLCFPVSQAEVEILRREGDGAFEDLLEAKGVDIFDFDRNSVV